jgi:hypothetical protein
LPRWISTSAMMQPQLMNCTAVKTICHIYELAPQTAMCRGPVSEPPLP